VLPGGATFGPVTVTTGVGIVLPLVAKLRTAEPVEFNPSPLPIPKAAKRKVMVVPFELVKNTGAKSSWVV
jgi:hypothetical protein